MINVTLKTNETANGNESLAALWQSQRMQTTEWIVAMSVSVVVTIFALYLVIALTYFEFKKRGFVFVRESEPSTYSTSENNASAHDSPVKTSDGTSPTKVGFVRVRRNRKPNHEERYEGWLRALNLLAAAYALLKCCSAQLDLQLGTTTAELCTGFAFTSVMCNGGSFICVYLLLWLRQWAVHSHPALQHLHVKKLRWLSWLLLGVIIITFISLCVLFFITIKVVQSPRGCMFADEGTVSQGARSGSGIVFTAVFQPALLALILYPLMKHTLNRRKAFGGMEARKASIGKPQDESEAKIYAIITRLLVSLILCSISDIGAVVGAFLLEEYPIYYISIVYDVNITFGSYVIAWSFNDWRMRIFPCCPRPKKSSEPRDTSSTYRNSVVE